MSKLLKQIKSIPKGYFTLTDTKKITSNTDESLSVAMGRLVKQGDIVRIHKGFYTADISSLDWEAFACAVYAPSYVSFESALAAHNVLSQRPIHISLATLRRSKRISSANRNVIYHHLKNDLFWGYAKNGGALLADAEKAFLDLLYLSLNGYAKFDPEEMNLDLLDGTKLKKYLRKFDNKRMDKVVEELL